MKNNVKKIVLTALFAALVYVGTLLRVPLPFGYANLGDVFVLLSSAFLGPVNAGLAGAIGAGLSDLLGYAIYAPATFVIKFAMGAVSAVLMNRIHKKIVNVLLAGLAAELIMVGGYFLYDSFLYGIFGAASSVAGNGLQGIVALCFAVIFVPVAKRISNSNK